MASREPKPPRCTLCGSTNTEWHWHDLGGDPWVDCKNCGRVVSSIPYRPLKQER